jgi:YgiT-type zinc finger domain-containing protein
MTWKCAICGADALKSGLAVLTLVRGRTVVVFRDVPATICANCGEEYFDEATTSRLLTVADQAAVTGVEVEVRTYAA